MLFSMLLYIHVPFCRRKCRYCAFYSEPLREDTLPLWEEGILAEMRRYSSELGRKNIDTVFFGGGTPSLVPPAMTGRILEEAARFFSLAEQAEISMEANPESITAEKAAAFRTAGVNRVSLGVQALDDALLRAAGRIHSKADALSAFRALRQAGFDNLGIDLIWGLPGEHLQSWKKQLSLAASLEPEHLSCYGLTLEEGTPLFRERNSLSFPDEEECAAMYLEGGALLEEQGYQQYEISNYARKGRECRHNLGYWLGEDYLGLGPSAVGTLSAKRITQPSDFASWLSSVREGRSTGTEEHLSFRDRAEELVMLRLRMKCGLLLEEYRRMTGRRFEEDNCSLLEELFRQDLAKWENGRVFLTRRGMLLSNAIIAECFETIPSCKEQA